MSTRKDFPVAQTVKNLPVKQETRVWSLDWELQSAPVFLPGEFHGQRSLAGYSPWSRRVAHDWVTDTHTVLTRKCPSPSASTRSRLLVAAVADLQHTLKGVQGRDQEWSTLCSEKTWQNRPSVRYFQKKLAQFLASSI